MNAAPQTKSLIKFKIEATSGPHAGESFSFSNKSIFIGRGAENEICLSQDPRISRQHAEIKQISGQFYIVNLSSKNFVLVNGEQIDTDLLGQNAVIQIGESELTFSAEFPNLFPDLKISEPAALVHRPAELTKPEESPPKQLGPGQLVPGQAVETKLTPVQPRGGGVPLSPRPPQAPSSIGLASPIELRPRGASPVAHSRGASAKQAPSRPRPPSRSPPENSRLKFYGITFAVIAGVLFFLFSGEKKTKKVEMPFRGSPAVATNIAESLETTRALDLKISRQNDLTYRRAQENQIKGFREFRQGNYARARDYFQVALSLDPANEIAKTYYSRSLVKFDELIQANLIQGMKYRERKNYRLCRASFSNVLIMIQYNKSHPQFAEANQYYDECTKAIEGQR